MNSKPACRVSLRLGALFCLLLFTAGLLSGCARLKQYSVDSWQGPLPVRDMAYAENEI